MTENETIIDILDNIIERLADVEERTAKLEETLFEELRNL